jgi:hypothetical protein
VACLTATNVSPPDRFHCLFAKVAQLLFTSAEDREIRAPANSTAGPKIAFGLDRKLDSLLAPFQCQFMQLLQIAVQIEFLVGTG